MSNANTAFGAIGDENESLSRALGLLPTTLRKANTTFVNLRAALEDVDQLVSESKPNTKELDTFFARLRPLVADARPTVKQPADADPRQGKNNDLIELTGKLPRLEQLTYTTFPRQIRTFDRSQEFVDSCARTRPTSQAGSRSSAQGASPVRRQRPLRPCHADVQPVSLQ